MFLSSCQGQGAPVGQALDPHYHRPTEGETLLGDATKARVKLGWTQQLALQILRPDDDGAHGDSLVKDAGFQAYDYHE